MEQRFKEIDSRLDRVEDRQDKLEEAQKKTEIEFAETRVYVREGYKKMNDISVSLEAMKTSSSSKWEQFFQKAFWFAIGLVGTYLATKFNLK